MLSNEGVRFKSTIAKAQRLTRVKTQVAGADAIYASNKNQGFASSNEIHSNLKTKGIPSKNRQQQDVFRAAITKQRATYLEGSFGRG